MAIKLSNIAVYDLVETKVGSRLFGSKRDPYVKVTVGSKSCQTSCKDGAGTQAEWEGEVLRLEAVRCAAAQARRDAATQPRSHAATQRVELAVHWRSHAATQRRG